MTRRTQLSLFLLALVSLLTSPQPASAQGVPYFASVSGHAFGERITVHPEMVRYLEALAEKSPRVRVEDQGTSWEGRHLLLAIVTSPENHARLDEIRQNAEKLGDPRQVDPGELDALIENQPAIVWLGGSIHGFELSGSEGLLKLLEHLTTRDDETTRQVLENAVVLIDPMLNPDGRDAFAHWNHQRVGRQVNGWREDWSNQTTFWQALQFRTGHYFFDTNRDWFAHTQLETKNRMATFRKWRPQVAVDAHEMGPDVEFYFDPPMEPFGVHFPTHAQKWFERFNRSYASAFDGAGFEYTTRELFNYYYPGYTTSWNSYQGAVGMLYEQGSSRGLALEISDGSVRSLSEALEHQYTAAWTATRTAAEQRRDLQREFHQSLRADVKAGQQGVRRYLIAEEGDPLHVRELVLLLQRNGIEVSVLSEEASLSDVRDASGESVGTRKFAAGTHVVDAGQPRQRLLRTLLDPELPMPKDFLAEARGRLDRGENPRFYDITAWSLPLLFHVGGYSSPDGRALETRAVETQAVETQAVDGNPAESPLSKATYAYLIDGRAAASLAVMHHLRDRGYRVAVTLKPTRFGGLDVASGSGIVRVGDHPGRGNDASVHAAVRELAQHYGVGVRAVGTGRADDARAEGTLPTLGSVETVALKPTAVAILAEQPVHGYSFGWTWYTLDRQYEIPVTSLPVRTVASTPLHRFQTLVIPDLFSAEGLAKELGEGGVLRLKGWVRDGGNLVALGGAVEFVRKNLELSALRSWYEENEEEDVKPRRFPVPGAIFGAELDREAWLTAGYDGSTLPFLLNSAALYLAPEGPPNGGRRVAVRIPEEGDARISGHVWPETLERVPGAVLAYDERVGGGRVVLFPEDLNFRAYWRGVDRLFLNAVLLGPSAP